MKDEEKVDFVHCLKRHLALIASPQNSAQKKEDKEATRITFKENPFFFLLFCSDFYKNLFTSFALTQKIELN